MNKCVSLLSAVLLLGGSMALFAQSPTAEKLAAGNYVVYAVSPQAWRFTVDPKTMTNAILTGHFSITEGTPKDIDVYVFKDTDYFKWRAADPTARANFKPLFSSIKKGDGDLNVKVTEAGNYYVIFSNLYQYEGTKKLTADVKLQYEKH